LSTTERKAYTTAVLCLMSKPARTDSKAVPGAKSRYDDFLYTHINQTLSIHGTANFLSWHRYFTWNFEQALRNECGYTGYQPVRFSPLLADSITDDYSTGTGANGPMTLPTRLSLMEVTLV
jgi:tyrosinase